MNKLTMLQQSQNLASEWGCEIKSMLVPEVALDSAQCRMVAEVFDGSTYSRIHRRTSGMLVLEERKNGSMYPAVWELNQDAYNEELERLFQERSK